VEVRITFFYRARDRHRAAEPRERRLGEKRRHHFLDGGRLEPDGPERPGRPTFEGIQQVGG